jgi:hypothetical protein
MSTIYSGNPGNVSNSLTRTITGAANNGSGLIRITTSGSHLFSPHDVVIITGVVGTTEANGTWSINVIGSTTFDLVGSTFTHAYVSGGSAVDRSLTPAATVPSDGDQITATSLVAPLQVCLDRTQFLATQPVAPAILTIPPFPFNISDARDWSVGDATTLARLQKLVPNDNAVVIDITKDLRPYAGMRLALVTAVFAVGQSHSGVPAILPDLRCYRTQSLATLGVAPSAGDSLLAAIDAPFPTPGSGSAYYASGNLQAWSLTPDQNNVIDATRRYYVLLLDESGANAEALNIYFGFRLTVN